MGALVPFVHLVQQLVGLVNGQHRAFNARRELRAGHDHGNFNDAFLFRVQPGHFAVQPDQVLVRFFKREFNFGHLAILADSLNFQP